jgi:septum site-determining protein MinC
MQKTRKPIEIKISTVVAISALLHEAAPAAIDQALKDMTGGASDFFEDEFAVLDIAALPAGTAIDWPALVAIFKSYRLHAVAVRHAPPELHAEIVAHGLSIDTPVRAGTRIYARGADLVVMAAVNNGAEIIADGSIHVYAPLRGRALAGASGNADARIFTTSMEAELISIAGVYRTFEKDLPADLAQKPVQIKLTGDRLDVLAIKNS